MKTECYRIKRSPDSNLWLDYYDEDGYRWTVNEKRAWPFLQVSSALRRLALVLKDIPTAVIVPSSF